MNQNPPDLKQAYRLLNRAAAGGDVVSAFTLGMKLLENVENQNSETQWEGNPVERAIKLLWVAADGGVDGAASALAMAKEWLVRARVGGNEAQDVKVTQTCELGAGGADDRACGSTIVTAAP
jgi:hypothetical protein